MAPGVREGVVECRQDVVLVRQAGDRSDALEQAPVLGAGRSSRR